MTNVTCFEDLEVWKLSMNLTVSVYRYFKECKDFGFKNQIQRACVSIPSNIAEGFARKTNKEFCQFLYIARGSCAEVRTQIYLAKQLTYIENEFYIKCLNVTDHISRMLYNMIKYRSSL
ncbi:MAG: four helix bundle protein [Bacteroidetes bacterium]|nr:four helix bundle protein [Bacteroidota bacterium]MCL2302177.1 four helix bundle protein [Lentimicrobiaceae bacterium]